MVKELTDAQLKVELTKDLPIIVDFWASWCGPCKQMAPVFDELSKEYTDKLRFVKISTEENESVVETYSIQGIPCFILFNKGEEVDRLVGTMDKDGLKSKIDKLMGKL